MPAAKKDSVTAKKSKRIPPVGGFEWLYLQYLLVTGLYMLEPWERTIFNSVLLLILSAGAALLYTFFPILA